MNYTKAGARHSSADQGHIQEAHDRLVSAGALCGGVVKAWTPPSAIKARADGKVEGLLVRYTTPNELDLEGDYFDRNTNLGVNDGDTLITLWHHNLDPEKRGVIGKGIVKYTDAGLWYQTWLNRRDAYEQLILQLVEAGKCGYSGGASTVLRTPATGKARRITKFTLVEGSITPTPMDAGSRVSLKAFMSSKSALSPEQVRRLRELEDILEDHEADIEADDVWAGRLLRQLSEI